MSSSGLTHFSSCWELGAPASCSFLSASFSLFFPAGPGATPSCLGIPTAPLLRSLAGTDSSGQRGGGTEQPVGHVCIPSCHAVHQPQLHLGAGDAGDPERAHLLEQLALGVQLARAPSPSPGREEAERGGRAGGAFLEQQLVAVAWWAELGGRRHAEGEVHFLISFLVQWLFKSMFIFSFHIFVNVSFFKIFNFFGCY